MFPMPVCDQQSVAIRASTSRPRTACLMTNVVRADIVHVSLPNPQSRIQELFTANSCWACFVWYAPGGKCSIGATPLFRAGVQPIGRYFHGVSVRLPPYGISTVQGLCYNQ